MNAYSEPEWVPINVALSARARTVRFARKEGV